MPSDARSGPAGEVALVISRTFNAPREAVFAAFTEADKLAKWWGPAGIKIDVLRLELRPGGLFHYKMNMPTGDAVYGRFIYQVVEAPSRLAFTNSFANAEGGSERHFLSPTWPLEVANVWTFEADGDRTVLSGRGVPLNASPIETATFVSALPMMQVAFDGTLDQLAAFLASA